MANGTQAYAVRADAPEKDNPLRTAEMTLEDDYGMIDGVINNGRRGEELEKAKEHAERTQPEKKPSIRERLAAAKQECAKQQPRPAPKKKPRSWGSCEPGREVAAGMGLLPGGERQAAVQPALQGLRPSLQAELPGGGVGLPALPVPACEKRRK